MADQLDKYVMEYIVETKDSIKRLEDFVTKMDEAEKKSASSEKATGLLSKTLKGFAGEVGAAGETVTGFVENMGELAAVAGGPVTAAIAAVVAVVLILKKTLEETKAVMDELMEQRNLGARIGMSGVAVENVTRNVERTPGNQLTRGNVEDLLSKLSEKLKSAYADPMQMNRDALILRRAGVSVNDQNGGMNSTSNALREMADNFKNASQEQARALGGVIGLTIDQSDALHKLGSAITDTTHLTAAEVVARQEAERKTLELSSASKDLSEHWRELRDDILIHVIPAIDTIVKALDGLIHVAERVRDGVGNGFKKVWDFTKNHVSNAGRDIKDLAGGDFKKFFKDVSGEWDESGKQINQSAQTMVDTSNKDNEAQLKQQSELERIINLFSQSVTQFSDTIDERQAWAAWAGEIGRASGLSKSGNVSLGATGTYGNSVSMDKGVLATMQGTNGTPVATATGADNSTGAEGQGTLTADNGAAGSPANAHMYDAIFKAAAAKYGISPELLKKVAMAESTLNPTAKSKAGATGLMQIMPSNFESLGITNAYNPQQNIFGGAQLLSQLLKEFNGNVDMALKAYNGGQNQSKWGNKETSNYVQRVMSQNATFGDNVAAYSPDFNNPMLSPLARYSLDPKAKPLYDFHGSPLIDAGAGGESREKTQLLSVQKMLAGEIGGGISVAQIQQGDVNIGDEKWAASNLIAKLANSRAILKTQMDVPGLSNLQRSGMEQQLRTTDLQMQNLMRYIPQIESRAQPGDRNITIGAGAVQVNVNGANFTAEDLAKEINNTFADHLNEVVNGYSDGTSY